MDKQAMREEAERLIRETMERKALVVKQGNTRIETTCGKCGAPNRISAEKGRDPRQIRLQAMRAQARDAVRRADNRNFAIIATGPLGNVFLGNPVLGPSLFCTFRS